MPSVGQQQRECSDGSETSNITRTHTVREVQLIWVGACFQSTVHGSFNRFLYTTRLSTINMVYHEVLLVSILVAMACLFRASCGPFFYGLEGLRVLLSSMEWSVINASSGKHPLSTCQGLIGWIWVPVPMVHWSRMGEVGSFHLQMDLIPQKRLAIPFPGSVYFRGIHMDQHHGLQ